MKLHFLPLAFAALMIATPATASEDESWERWEAQQVLKAEFDRARAVGGYNNLFTALANIARGEATDKDVVSPLHSLHELPEWTRPAKAD